MKAWELIELLKDRYAYEVFAFTDQYTYYVDDVEADDDMRNVYLKTHREE